MVNSFDGLITQSLKTQFSSAINEIIRGFKTPARFFFPITKYTPCTVCSSTYDSTPNPYLLQPQAKNTSCPSCNSTGQVGIENYSDLEIPVIYKNSKFKSFGDFVVTPRGDAQTFSNIGTIKIIKTCLYVVFSYDIVGLNKQSFTRDGEPEIMGLGNSEKFILTTWKILA